MIMRITEKQAEKVHALVRSACCNCVEDACLLLGGGEENTCVYLLCFSGIYCRYFMETVLPSEKKLLGEIKKYNEKRRMENERMQ